MQLMEYVQRGILKVIVKPNKMKNYIEGFDATRKAVLVQIAAPAEKDKANKELIRFLSRTLQQRVEIIKGLKSREKYVKII